MDANEVERRIAASYSQAKQEAEERIRAALPNDGTPASFAELVPLIRNRIALDLEERMERNFWLTFTR